MVVTVEAEAKHAFKNLLREIAEPTIVVGGADDFFYSPILFRETAACIPDTRLCLYKYVDIRRGRRFHIDLLTFLRENGVGSYQ
jgi:hypothetical protein